VAVAKLKETTTGDTFSDEKKPIVFEESKLPLPVVSYALTPKSKGDEDKITASLARIHEEDPTMMLGRDEQTVRSFSPASDRPMWRSSLKN